MSEKTGIISTKYGNISFHDYVCVSNKEQVGYMRRTLESLGKYNYYYFTKSVCDKLGGIDFLSSRYRELITVSNPENMQKVINTYIGVEKVYISRVNDKNLIKAGIRVVPYSDKGFYYSLFTDLENELRKHKINFRISYRLRGTSDFIYDNTGRSIADIVHQGYRGNRLDVMVSNYVIRIEADTKDGDAICLAARENGQSIKATSENQDIIDTEIIKLYLSVLGCKLKFLDIVMRSK
jgi:hypothetical protein